MAAETLTESLKALLTTWRESIPKHRAEASRLEDEGLSIYSMGESALATGKEKCADELDAALLALGERPQPETFAKHLADENTIAHRELDRLGAPKTKMVLNRAGDGKQEITIGFAERFAALRERQETAEPPQKVACPNCGCDYETAADMRKWKDADDEPMSGLEEARHVASGAESLAAAPRLQQILDEFNQVQIAQTRAAAIHGLAEALYRQEQIVETLQAELSFAAHREGPAETGPLTDNEVVDFLVAYYHYPDRATALKNAPERIFDDATLIRSWATLKSGHREGPATADELSELRNRFTMAHCVHQDNGSDFKDCRMSLCAGNRRLLERLSAHREGRPPAAETLEAKNDDDALSR